MELSHKQQTLVKILCLKEQIHEVLETLVLARREGRHELIAKCQEVLARLEHQLNEALELHSVLA